MANWQFTLVGEKKKIGFSSFTVTSLQTSALSICHICLSFCLSDFLHVTTQKLLNSFLCNFTLGNSAEMLQLILIFVQNLTIIPDNINEITAHAVCSTSLIQRDNSL